jgi:hypothetical protein
MEKKFLTRAFSLSPRRIYMPYNEKRFYAVGIAPVAEI